MVRVPLPMVLVLVLVLCAALTVTGCRNAPGPTAYTGVTSATAPDYPRAFEATKDVLREMGFELDRIDASAGVITTRARTGSGFATPWVPTETPVRDLTQRDRRRATVRFAPAQGVRPGDLRSHEGAIDIAWTIEVERVYVPGRRPSPTSVRLGGTWRDRDLPEAGERARFATFIENDEELAARGVRGVLERVNAPETP